MKTLRGHTVYEEHIKRSRFVAHAGPVTSQAATLAFFESVADAGASHNCWAWRVGGLHRFNDDGEPGGSAGRPILAVLEGRELEQVMVVVTRYFGGIRLGIGGLVRAYSGCAAKCLDRAEVVEQVTCRRFTLDADFEFSNTVYQLLAQFEGHKLQEQFVCDGLQMQVEIPAPSVKAFVAALQEASRGSARLRRLPDQD